VTADWQAIVRHRALFRVTKRKLKIFLLALAVVLVAGVYALSHPTHDFLEYWAAAHLLIQHKNPYSLFEMVQAEQSFGWKATDPIMFVGPPWALPLILPLSLFTSYALAWTIWVSVLIAAVAFSSRLLMDIYFGNLRIPELTDTSFNRCLFAFAFYPIILCLQYAQTTPFILLGLAGFLFFDGRNRPFAAGVLLSLTLVKPQLLFLVWLAVLLKSIQRREWKTLASVTLVVSALSVVTLMLDPGTFRNYHELATGPYLKMNTSGMVAMIRRWLSRGDISATYWMQFLAPLLGLLWFVFYWRKHRDNWDWRDRMPVLVTASVLTTAYGWIFDQTVLALPIIALAAVKSREQSRLPWNLVILYTALNCGLMLLMVVPPLTYIPTPIALAVLFFRNSSARPARMEQMKLLPNGL
jgi:hypothetical protein